MSIVKAKSTQSRVPYEDWLAYASTAWSVFACSLGKLLHPDIEDILCILPRSASHKAVRAQGGSKRTITLPFWQNYVRITFFPSVLETCVMVVKHAWIPIWNLSITRSSIPRAILLAYLVEYESSSSLSRQFEYGPKTRLGTVTVSISINLRRASVCHWQQS